MAIGVFLRIREQVHHDLSQRVPVAVDRQGRVGQLTVEPEPISLEMRAVGFGCLARDGGNVACLEVVFLLATFDASEIKDVVDQPGQTRRLRRDDGEIRALFGAVRDSALSQQFREHTNGSQRRLQLMRNVANEIGFLPRQRELAIQIGDNQPAPDADGGHQHGNEKPERQLECMRRAS